MERDSNPKFLVIDVAWKDCTGCPTKVGQGRKGLYRVSHQSWNKAGKRQGNRNIVWKAVFFGGISEFLVIDAEEGLAIFTIFLILIDEFI